MAGKEFLLQLSPGRLPEEGAGAVKSIKPFQVSRMEMVPPGLARPDGDEMEGRQEVLGVMDPPLPGAQAGSPGVILPKVAERRPEGDDSWSG